MLQIILAILFIVAIFNEKVANTIIFIILAYNIICLIARVYSSKKSNTELPPGVLVNIGIIVLMLIFFF